MGHRSDAIAEVLLATKPLFTRFLADFDESSRTRQATNLPNHVVWCLGHCAMTMHRVAEKFDGDPLPEDDFVHGDGHRGDAERFDTEAVCFGSSPVDDPSIYPTLARGRAIFERACDRFAAAIRSSPDETLDKRIPWHDGELTLAGLVARIAFHNGTHAGQLTDLRRALKFDRVIKPRA